MMSPETVPLASLKPPPRNVRMHPETQISELMRAIEMFGQTRPVVVDEDGTVLAGNGLVTALQRLQRSEVDVLRMSGLSKTAKTKLMLSDNKIAALGVDDYTGIMTLVRGLGGDLDIPGYEADLLSGLIASDTSSADAMKAFDGLPPPSLLRGTMVRAEGQTTLTCPHCGKTFTV